jgi:sugar phosphate isomerase/epimerase
MKCKNQIILRRDFLFAVAGTVLLYGCNKANGNISSSRSISKDRIGIQLYTVRDHMAVDLNNTLQGIAAIGYQEVEFAGYFDHSPEEIRTILSGEGLASPSTHIPLKFIQNSPNQIIDTALTIGHEYIVMPWIMPHQRSLYKYKEYIELFNKFGEQCQRVGLKFAYHNHDFEFEVIEGIRPIDLLIEETDNNLVSFELDLYWIIKAGEDPLRYIKKYPNRFPLWHIKDMANDGSMRDVGEGIIDFEEIFKLKSLSGLEHYYVEHDNPPDSLMTASKSFNALLKLNI